MRYSGGKGGAGVYQTIINMMPRHEVYIEPFAGGANIMERKRPARSNIAIDVDANQVASLTDAYSGDGRFQILHVNALKFLAEYKWCGNEVVYLDPPYLFSTRKSDKPLYKHEFGQNDQHHQLLDLLLEIQSGTTPPYMMISGYPSAMYDMLGWDYIEFEVQTRRGMATERLWMSFDPDLYIKHDYQYMGEDFRERERIKKKGNRWVKNLEAMPKDEQNYVIARLLESHGTQIRHHQIG